MSFLVKNPKVDIVAVSYTHLNVNEKKWTNYLHDENNPRSLPYDKVLSIFEDSHRQIWLTTQGGGFCKFHPETETFTSYDSRNGLPNDVVYQIVEDKEGLMWLTTNNGLVSFQPATGAMKVYTTANGLLGEQFNYRSSFETEDGTIYPVSYTHLFIYLDIRSCNFLCKIEIFCYVVVQMYFLEQFKFDIYANEYEGYSAYSLALALFVT